MQNFTKMDNINAKFLVISVFVLKEREKKIFIILVRRVNYVKSLRRYLNRSDTKIEKETLLLKDT